MANAVKIAVLGCGPSGLLAAWGAVKAAEAHHVELDVAIFSARRRSQLFGCQYLHEGIPGLELNTQEVEYKLAGTLDGYKEKVYGSHEDVAVSPALLATRHTAWDIRQAYNILWNYFEKNVVDYFLTPGTFRHLDYRLRQYGAHKVINTVPAPVLCQETPVCTFKSETVWAMGDAPELGRFAKLPVELPEGTILCNGKAHMPWYRISHVFGHHTIEWPEEAAPPHGASRVTKPLATTCVCNPWVVNSGRYARWQKGVLAHTSFTDGYRAVESVI